MMTENGLNRQNTPFFSVGCEEPAFPLLISVPHAGRHYPQSLLDNLAVPARHLLRLEDRLVDRLAGQALEAEVPTIIATRPRAWIDLNRSIREIDASIINGVNPVAFGQPSRKVRGGLGLVPSRLSGVGNLWRKKWDWEDIQSRIENDHQPYHEQIDAVLDRIKQKFGAAILVDLHSMPSLGKSSEHPAQIVIGDRFGKSASSVYSELSYSFFDRLNFRSQLNHPYPGGYMLERHGRPEKGIHAIQLEIDRALYLDEQQREPTQNLPQIAQHVLDMALLLADQLSGNSLLEAAE